MNARLYHLLILLWALAATVSLVSADYGIDDLPGEDSDDDSGDAYQDEFGEPDYYQEPTEESTAGHDTYDENPLAEEVAEEEAEYYEEGGDYF